MQVVTFASSGFDDALIGDLWELGTAGVLEKDDCLYAYFPDELDLTGLLEKYPAATTAIAAPQSFVEQISDPVPIGKRFVVVDPAADLEPSAYPGRQVLHVSASGAFGSGRHESTKLVVEALERLDLNGAVVLDVGCGSAITSEAARLLGASHVIACDIHFGSLQQARGNFSSIPLFLGSADAIASSSADIVIANISASVIDVLAAELARVARPGGTIILGGFTHHRRPTSFQPVTVSGKEDWLCWTTRAGMLAEQTGQRSIQPFEAVWW